MNANSTLATIFLTVAGTVIEGGTSFFLSSWITGEIFSLNNIPLLDKVGILVAALSLVLSVRSVFQACISHSLFVSEDEHNFKAFVAIPLQWSNFFVSIFGAVLAVFYIQTGTILLVFGTVLGRIVEKVSENHLERLKDEKEEKKKKKIETELKENNEKAFRELQELRQRLQRLERTDETTVEASSSTQFIPQIWVSS